MGSVTSKQLSAIFPRCPVDQLDRYARLLTSALVEAQINTITRAAAFLGQIGLESGELRWLEEFADGSDYEGREDLGNIALGDGPRYKGRGFIQLTGRSNYREYGGILGLPLEDQPELAADPEHGFRIAALYWTKKNLNQKADMLDYEGITRAINGGLNNYDRRQAYYFHALEVLGRETSL